MKQKYTTDANNLVNLFGTNFMEAENGDACNSIPAIDIKEQRNNYKIEMSIPGFRKEDFIVFVTDNMLTVSCKKEHEHPKGGSEENFLNAGYTRFTRQLALPKNADGNRVKAKYNGVLNLTVAKKQSQKSRTKILKTISVNPDSLKSS